MHPCGSATSEVECSLCLADPRAEPLCSPYTPPPPQQNAGPSLHCQLPSEARNLAQRPLLACRARCYPVLPSSLSSLRRGGWSLLEFIFWRLPPRAAPPRPPLPPSSPISQLSSTPASLAARSLKGKFVGEVPGRAPCTGTAEARSHPDLLLCHYGNTFRETICFCLEVTGERPSLSSIETGLIIILL